MARASLTITNTAERRPLEAVPSLTNFLNRRRIEDSRRQKKRKLAPEGYRTLRAKLNNCGSLAPNDADETKSNINNVKKKLIRYSGRHCITVFRLGQANQRPDFASTPVRVTGVKHSRTGIKELQCYSFALSVRMIG